MKKTPLRPKAQKEGFTESGLPTSGKMSETVERVTPEKKKDVEGMTEKGRVKFTTMLRPDLKSRLLMSADKQRMTLADMLEEILLERYNTQ
jgi:hypothetical protein